MVALPEQAAVHGVGRQQAPVLTYCRDAPILEHSDSVGERDGG